LHPRYSTVVGVPPHQDEPSLPARVARARPAGTQDRRSRRPPQVLRTDLEGDGVNEVIVVAEEVTPGFLMEVGDYSILFLRKVVRGDVQTAVLEETVVLSEDDQFAGSHIVGTVADLNGDSKMEIVTNSAYFEGFGVNVWEYVNDDIGPSIALQTGCGS